MGIYWKFIICKCIIENLANYKLLVLEQLKILELLFFNNSIFIRSINRYCSFEGINIKHHSNISKILIFSSMMYNFFNT